MFWIDAICINQDSVLERNHQVRMMKRIYRQAYSVISWLGPTLHDSGVILDLANQVHEAQNHNERLLIIRIALRNRSYDFSRSYTYLFRRSYWYRTWIIQEIFSASQLMVQCGPHTAPWEALLSLQTLLTTECFRRIEVDGESVYALNYHHIWLRNEYMTRPKLKEVISSADRFIDLSRLRSLRHRSENDEENRENRRLDRLLFENWDAMASDPRDKIFAIFRLASDRDEYQIEVDYDLSVNAVYTNVVVNFIQRYGNLSIILPRRFQDPNHYLPSWCPDWSNSTPASRMGNWKDAYPFQVGINSWEYFAAGYRSRAQVRFFNPTQFMWAKGFRLDSIHSTSNTMEVPERVEIEVGGDARKGFLDSLLSFFCFSPWHTQRVISRKSTEFDKWYAMHRHSLRAGFTQEYFNTRTIEPNPGPRGFSRYCRKKHKEFFWTLHRATNLYTDEMPEESRSATTRRRFREWRSNQDIPQRYSARQNDVMTPDLWNVCREMGEIEINENHACFFLTRNGFMGLGPRDMEGDLVVIFHGCWFPVLVRWKSYCYKIVGACYLAGFMHGEFGRDGWNTRVREEPFELC